MDDWGFDELDKAEPTAPPTGDRQPMPQGRHTFKIDSAGEEDGKLKLVLSHGHKAYFWVRASLPKGEDWGKRIVLGLIQSLGLTPDDWKLMDPGDLVGRAVDAEIYHQTKGDRTYVNVRKFLPTGKPADEPKPVAKRAAPVAADDSIPF